MDHTDEIDASDQQDILIRLILQLYNHLTTVVLNPALHPHSHAVPLIAALVGGSGHGMQTEST